MAKRKISRRRRSSGSNWLADLLGGSNLRSYLIIIGILGLLCISISAVRDRITGAFSGETTGATNKVSIPTKAETAVDFDLDLRRAVLLPEDTPSQIKDYKGFTLSFNKNNRTPNYVAWELTKEETEGGALRDGVQFWKDHEIKKCPESKDYSNSGYDRGHMIPAADQKWHATAMSDCFSMANMCPQVHVLNAGAWKTLEEKERLWAKRDGSLIIIAGPIYEDSDKKHIGHARVRVPSAFFKVLYALETDTPRAIAFVYPNDRAPGNMQDYSMTVDRLEAILDYDFLPDLPESLQSTIESTTSFKTWNRR